MFAETVLGNVRSYSLPFFTLVFVVLSRVLYPSFIYTYASLYVYMADHSGGCSVAFTHSYVVF